MSCLYSYCFNYCTYFVVAIVVVVFVAFADIDVVVAEKVNLEIICPCLLAVFECQLLFHSFIGISQTILATSYLKWIDIWMTFTMTVPFLEVYFLF